MNVSVLCRTCMKELGGKELEHIDGRAIKMYMYCTKIRFDGLNDLPKHFCSECSIKIKSTFTFIRKAQAVNETLKKLIYFLALNQPNDETNKSEPTVNEEAAGDNNNDKDKDPRTELEQAIHYLGTEYDIESAIDDADEAVDSFFKNLEESTPIIKESTTEAKTESDEINHIYNFVAPSVIKKTNEENSWLNNTSKTYTNSVMETDVEPTTVTENCHDRKDNTTQNCATTLPDIDPNMVIIVPHIPAPYDENATDPIDILNDTNATTVTLVDEISEISDNNDKTTNCPVCGKSFPGDDELAVQEHMLFDHPDDPEEYADPDNTNTDIATKQYPAKCDICAKVFNSITWYNKHLAREHNNEVFKCNDCNKVYITYASWKEHKKIHAVHMNCICPVCDKHFRKTSQLAEHIVIHSDERPFSCPQCSKRFKLRVVLERHMKTHLKVRKTILCDYCGKSFLSIRGLGDHMTRHTGSKPFACDVCEFRAQYRTSLVRHKLRHTQYRPHECKLCKKSFYNTDDLQRHSRSHTGERPYKCPYCTRSFAEHNKRKAHLVNHHQLIFEDIPRLNRDGTPYVENSPGVTAIPTAVIQLAGEI